MKEFLIIACTIILCLSIHNIGQFFNDENNVPLSIGIYSAVQMILSFVGLMIACNSVITTV